MEEVIDSVRKVMEADAEVFFTPYGLGWDTGRASNQISILDGQELQELSLESSATIPLSVKDCATALFKVLSEGIPESSPPSSSSTPATPSVIHLHSFGPLPTPSYLGWSPVYREANEAVLRFIKVPSSSSPPSQRVQLLQVINQVVLLRVKQKAPEQDVYLVAFGDLSLRNSAPRFLDSSGCPVAKAVRMAPKSIIGRCGLFGAAVMPWV